MREERPGVEAVERALAVLEAFAPGDARLSLAQLAERTGLYKSTILRLSASLERFGYLRRDGEGYFRLGPTLWRLGALYQRSFDLADVVRPMLARLVAELGQTAAFYVRDGDRRICLFRNNSPSPTRHHVEEGASLPVDQGASGRILLAFGGAPGARYDEIRRKGVYTSYGERDPDAAAVAAPVFDAAGGLVGAISVSGLRTHFDEPFVRRATARVTAAARDLTAALGGRHRADR
ncbi:MAG TPA: IclR family transcriptional regulator [Thermodesulfobacteriota bacterium]